MNVTTSVLSALLFVSKPEQLTPLLFHDDTSWYIFDAKSKTAQRIKIPDDTKPTGLALSKTGIWAVITKPGKSPNTTEFVKLDLTEKALPIVLSTQSGYFDEPTLVGLRENIDWGRFTRP